MGTKRKRVDPNTDSGPVANGSMLSPYEVVDCSLDNDARNVEWASREPGLDFRTRPALIADCAIRLVDAMDLGDTELTRRAERNLRDAVALPWSMCARLGPERCWCGRGAR